MLWGATLNTVGCLVVTLATTQEMPVAVNTLTQTTKADIAKRPLWTPITLGRATALSPSQVVCPPLRMPPRPFKCQLLYSLAQMKHNGCCSHPLCRSCDLSDVSPLSRDNQRGPLCTQLSVGDTASILTSPPHSEAMHTHHLPPPPTTVLMPVPHAHLEVAFLLWVPLELILPYLRERCIP